MMFAFAIIQLIFWTVQCYCCCLPLIYTPVKDVSHEAKKEHKKEEKKTEKEMKKYQKTM